MKICGSCRLELPDDNFAWRNKSLGIKARCCKSCHSISRKKNYENNKTKNYNYVYERRRSLYAWIKEYKSSLKCNRCDESHPATLDFHHKDPKQKEITLSTVVRKKGWSVSRMQKEIDKCEVLCANCHRKEHWRV